MEPHNTVFFCKGSACSLLGFSYSDFAGCKSDRKRTNGTCHLFWKCLVCSNSKKKHNISLSITEAEYVVAGSCCEQVLWIQKQLLDCNLKFGRIAIKCENTSAISLTKNLVLHWRTKHIEIQHHFLRVRVEKGVIIFEYIDTKNQLADIFTKTLSSELFHKICRELEILDSSCLK